jgi:hypothetical protein
VISAENFSTMIGYRRPRSANSPEITGFRPSLPYAGTLEAGQRQQQAPMPEPEKKAPPEPEKKDGN